MRKLNIVLLIVALVAAAAAFISWKGLLESRIKAALAEQGLQQLAFSLESVGLRSVTFKDIALGGSPLRLDRLTVDYSLPELWQGYVREIHANELLFKQGGMEVKLRDALLRFTPTGEPKSWQGSWTAPAVDVKGAALPLPTLSGEGKFAIGEGKTTVEGAVKSANGSHRAAFTMQYNAADLKHSRLLVQSASLPWNGGVLSTHNAAFPLDGGTAHLTLDVRRVSLEAVMQLLTGDRAKATGAVSGSVPIAIGSDGKWRLAGSLHAEGPGTIALSPDAIPGDNAQVLLVRDVLKDFHYSQFSMELVTGKDNKLSILLSLAGNNPGMYNGREVKLNVHLGGDLLNLLQQSIMPFTDPTELLK